MALTKLNFHSTSFSSTATMIWMAVTIVSIIVMHLCVWFIDYISVLFIITCSPHNSPGTYMKLLSPLKDEDTEAPQTTNSYQQGPGQAVQRELLSGLAEAKGSLGSGGPLAYANG